VGVYLLDYISLFPWYIMVLLKRKYVRITIGFVLKKIY